MIANGDAVGHGTCSGVIARTARLIWGEVVAKTMRRDEFRDTPANIDEAQWDTDIPRARLQAERLRASSHATAWCHYLSEMTLFPGHASMAHRPCNHLFTKVF